MTDDRGPTWRKKTPAVGRDVYTPKHEAVPQENWDEPATGRVELDDEQVARIRARRPTPERIRRVEERQDKTDQAVARMEGKVDTLVDLAQRRELAEAAERESKRKTLPATIKAIGMALAAVIAALVGYGAAR